MSNPATLTPVGYLQFETGTLGATDSPEFSTRYEFNEVIKLAVTRRLEFIESSEPAVHYTVNGVSANGVAEVFLGAQVVLLPGEGAKPTLSASYSRRIYDGGAPELDVGSPLNSTVFYASADVKGFHYDANAIFNEQLEGPVRRLQFGQTLSISHPLGKGFALSGEIWRFSQPFLHGNAIGNLWAVSYAARKTLVFDAGFDKGLTARPRTGKPSLASLICCRTGCGAGSSADFSLWALAVAEAKRNSKAKPQINFAYLHC